jgi:hypothetical protein
MVAVLELFQVATISSKFFLARFALQESEIRHLMFLLQG